MANRSLRNTAFAAVNACSLFFVSVLAGYLLSRWSETRGAVQYYVGGPPLGFAITFVCVSAALRLSEFRARIFDLLTDYGNDVPLLPPTVLVFVASILASALLIALTKQTSPWRILPVVVSGYLGGHYAKEFHKAANGPDM